MGERVHIIYVRVPACLPFGTRLAGRLHARQCHGSGPLDKLFWLSKRIKTGKCHKRAAGRKQGRALTALTTEDDPGKGGIASTKAVSESAEPRAYTGVLQDSVSTGADWSGYGCKFK